jgi:hypothetical protein
VLLLGIVEVNKIRHGHILPKSEAARTESKSRFLSRLKSIVVSERATKSKSAQPIRTIFPIFVCELVEPNGALVDGSSLEGKLTAHNDLAILLLAFSLAVGARI